MGDFDKWVIEVVDTLYKSKVSNGDNMIKQGKQIKATAKVNKAKKDLHNIQGDGVKRVV